MWQSFLNDYWPIVADNWPLLRAGVWTTLSLVSASLLCGLVLAIPFGAVLASKRAPWWLKAFPAAFSYVLRGTPMLVQLYIIYYGTGLQIGDIAAIRESALWPVLRQPYIWALLSFALNTAAYTSEIVRGAIETVPKGELEAAQAMGMSPALIARRIVFPNALRRAIPAYGNEIIFLLHGSAIASTITIMDITGVAQNLFSRYYEPFTPFIAAGVLYLAITLTIVLAFRLLEHRFNRHLMRRTP